jgi:hypothetical protein
MNIRRILREKLSKEYQFADKCKKCFIFEAKIFEANIFEANIFSAAITLTFGSSNSLSTITILLQYYYRHRVMNFAVQKCSDFQ